MNQSVLFLGVQPSDGNTLMQPELWFHSQAGTYDLQAQVCQGGSCPAGTSPFNDVQEGDSLYAYTSVINWNATDGEEWIVFIQDQSSSDSPNYTNLLFWTGSANPALNQALPAIMEVQGLKGCDGLPGFGQGTTGNVEFSMSHLYQEGTGSTGWEPANWQEERSNVTYFFNTSQPPGPACAYTGSMAAFAIDEHPVVTWLNGG